MKPFAFFVALTLLIGLLFSPLKTNAVGPFGGSIIKLTPCADGVRITLGPPTPGYFMYFPDTISYLFGPPAHPGQWLLGLSGPPIACFVSCDEGLCLLGWGDFIIYHGSSI